ncbi:MAG: SDR family oxidoreductase [Acidobacteria bacterium]|nr:SDR family oxidoreductase [Acidobacteriota bacterium]
MSRNDASTVRRPPARRDLPWPLLAAGIAAWAASRLMRRSRAISFEGRVAVISGGSRGLGLLIARLLAADGARLALLARDPEELRRAADDIEQRGHERPFVQPCDIRERLQAEQAIREVAAHFGRIDVLVNDAGMIEVGPLEHMTVNDFETSMGVHFWGPLYLTLAALPHLKKHRGARLVNISSIGGRVAVPHLVPYSAGKFALTGLSDGLRAELAKDGIRVTTVLPWLMRTGSPFNAWFKGQHRAEFAWFTIFDSLPGLTVDGERAARRIVDACRHGDPEAVTAVYARLAIVADAMFPSFVARSMALMNRLLPAAGPGFDAEARSGWQSRSRWAPSALTKLTEKATAANNEVPR